MATKHWAPEAQVNDWSSHRLRDAGFGHPSVKGQQEQGKVTGSDWSKDSGRKVRCPEHLALIRMLRKLSKVQKQFPWLCFVWKSMTWIESIHSLCLEDPPANVARTGCLTPYTAKFRAKIWDTTSSKLQTKVRLCWFFNEHGNAGLVGKQWQESNHFTLLKTWSCPGRVAQTHKVSYKILKSRDRRYFWVSRTCRSLLWYWSRIP